MERKYDISIDPEYAISRTHSEGEGNIKIRLKRDMTGGEEDYYRRKKQENTKI